MAIFVLKYLTKYIPTYLITEIYVRNQTEYEHEAGTVEKQREQNNDEIFSWYVNVKFHYRQHSSEYFRIRSAFRRGNTIKRELLIQERTEIYILGWRDSFILVRRKYANHVLINRDR